MMPATPDDVHISEVLINAPMDVVWTWVSDPTRFSAIYPNWISEVTRVSADRYTAVTPKGDRFEIIPRRDRTYGVADFEIVDEDSNAEVSRSRVYPLKADRCVIVYLTSRQDGVDDALWQDLKAGIKADREHVREVIERDAMQCSTSLSDVTHEPRADETRLTGPAIGGSHMGEREKLSRRYPYEYNEHNEALELLVHSKVDGEIHIPTYARCLLEHLMDTGLLHTKDNETYQNVRKVKLTGKEGKEQELWVRFDTYRSPIGYMDVDVVDAPRSDTAIIAAMFACLAKPIDVEQLKRATGFRYSPEGIAQLNETFSFVEGMRQGQDYSFEEWQATMERLLALLDEQEAHESIRYLLPLIKYYKPEIDNYPPCEVGQLLEKTCVYVNGFLDSLRKLQDFLEYGTANLKRLSPVTENPRRDVRATILADVEGLSHRQIGERMRLDIPDTSMEKGGHVTIDKAVERGRRILEMTFGEEGWRRRAEAMKAERHWWRALSREERHKVKDAEMLALQFSIPIEEARRQGKFQCP